MQFLTNRKWFFFIVLACLSLWFSGAIQREVQFFQGRAAANPGDFQVYYTAGLVIRKTSDKLLYSYQEVADPGNAAESVIVNPQLDFINPDSTFAGISQEYFPSPQGTMGKTQYLYPPFAALFISPLTYLPYNLATKVWYALSLLLIFASIFLAVKIQFSDYFSPFLLSGLIFFIIEFAFPVQDLLWSGNVGAVILFLCSLGLFCLHKKYPVASSFFIALAVFIKLTPLILLPILVIRRQWKWLFAFVGWCVFLGAISFWLLGWQNHQEFLTKIMPSMSNGIAERNNRSLATIGEFVKTGSIPKFEDFAKGSVLVGKDSNLPAKLIGGSILAVLLFFFWRYKKDESSILEEANLFLLLSLIVSPISWRHGYVLAIFPLVCIWFHPSTIKSKKIILAVLSAATFFIFSVIPDYALSVINSFVIQLLLVSIMPLGILLTIICWLYIQQHSPETDKNVI